MYVNHEHQFLFIHIPKTGGTTILKSLFYHQYGVIRIGHRHSPLSSLPEPQRYRDYYIFALVRNPYRRFASSYRFNKIYSIQRPETQHHYETFHGFLTNEAINHPIHRLQSAYVEHPFLEPVVLKYEKFDEAIAEIINNTPTRIRYIYRNKRVHYLGEYDYRDWLDEPGVEFINENYAEDFRRFDYPMMSWGEMLGSTD